MLGSHCLWQKMVLYEESALTPLSVRLPGGRRAGVACPDPTSHLDVFPTLCDLTGIKTPDTVSGRSLRPQIEGTASEESRPIFIQSDGNGSLEKWSRGIVSGDHKLIVDGFKDEMFFELYNLGTDPAEAHNTALDDDAAVLQHLAVLQQHMQHTGDAVQIDAAHYHAFRRDYAYQAR